MTNIQTQNMVRSHGNCFITDWSLNATADFTSNHQLARTRLDKHTQ